jgi:hypothetical protein
MSRSAPPARCAPSTPGSPRAAASRSRCARPRASSRCWPGTYSARTRTTATARRRSPSASLRTLQRKAGDTGPRISLAGETKRKALERRFLEEAERNYRHYVATKARGNGAGAATGDATVEAVKAADDARQAPQSPRRLLFSFGVTHARKDSYTQPLTFSSGCAGRDRRTVSGRGVPRTRVASLVTPRSIEVSPGGSAPAAPPQPGGVGVRRQR